MHLAFSISMQAIDMQRMLKERKEKFESGTGEAVLEVIL